MDAITSVVVEPFWLVCSVASGEKALSSTMRWGKKSRNAAFSTSAWKDSTVFAFLRRHSFSSLSARVKTSE